ncbi:adenylate/guanylate cyclase domain-containing protein [Iodobacter sp. LRB]|uniref:CHASE2 domain-containing protein n=1 Tax=unclassified Iodobacter TaxID=235634 RepID=UPI000C0ED7D4|nr:adenylate/guanylate cyclase domain-containing protein [Iodobacter sp. BJB302]PHV02985.1 adenylate/guanylate cyclase domain-containing protein [Iodobacter sp. BJB302]
MKASFRKHWPQVLLGALLLLLALMHVLGTPRLPTLSQIDVYLYDVRLRLGMPGGIDSRIVIVDIDEKSLGELGRWPWRRDHLAKLIDQLFDHYQIKTVGFDVVFAEPDESSGLPVLRRMAANELSTNTAFKNELNRLTPELDTDARFAKALSNRSVITGFYFSNEAKAVSSGTLPPAILKASDLAPVSKQIVGGKNYGGNLPGLQQAAGHGGHFVPILDSDGIARRVSLVVKIGEDYYPALGLALARMALGQEAFSPVIEESTQGVYALEAFRLGNRRLPVNENGWALIPFKGPQGSFPYVSAADVISGKVSPEILKDKIVLLGTTAPGLKDLRATPVGESYAGVEIHANLIAAILDQSLPQHPGYLFGAEFLLLLIMGPLLIWVLIRFSPLFASVFCLLLMLFLTAGNLALWHYAHLDMPMAASLMIIVGLYTLNMAYGYFFESRRKRQLTQLFGQYVVPELVERMSEDPEKYTMEGQNRPLTVLFTDVRSFTKISEGMPADELSRFMNEFLTEISTVIRHQHLGTIDKYIGDCVMAFWGAPVFDPDHAQNAVLASLEIQEAIHQLNPKLAARNWPTISVGVGVNTGNVTVGDMGSQFRMNYTVMGDAVNLASRVESLTKYYGVSILVSENTRNAAPNLVYREIDRVRVMGKTEAVTLYEPLPLTRHDEAALILFHESLKLYRKQEWDLAEMQLLNLQKITAENEHILYRVYLERIQNFRRNPPGSNWDGVHQFDSK